jgi:DNA-binding MarR family transcriptional regulator
MSKSPAQIPNPDGVATLVSLLKVATRIASPMRDAVADPEGLSVTELRIVLALGGEGALAGHDLAELMAMQPMNVSRALATLTGMGLVEAVTDSSNRRRRPHGLSAAGKAKFMAMQPEMASVASFLFGGLSKGDRSRLGQLLDRLDSRLTQWEAPEGQRHIARP